MNGTQGVKNDGAKHCSRCGAAFECKVDDLRHCACVKFALPAQVLEALQARFTDCLCPECLRTIAETGKIEIAA